MSLTKIPLGRNNSVMTSLFPPRESLVVTSRLGTGNSRTFFYGACRHRQIVRCAATFVPNSLSYLLYARREYSTVCLAEWTALARHKARVFTPLYRSISEMLAPEHVRVLLRVERDRLLRVVACMAVHLPHGALATGGRPHPAPSWGSRTHPLTHPCL